MKPAAFGAAVVDSMTGERLRRTIALGFRKHFQGGGIRGPLSACASTTRAGDQGPVRDVMNRLTPIL